MEQVLFVVWRESVEAMLVIGILHTWLSHQPQARRGMLWLWCGVAAGLGLAILLAMALFTANTMMSEHQDHFQVIMVLLAALLIVHMVFWMRSHGPTLQHQLQTELDRRIAHQNWWSVLALAAIAVAREGCETVVFLYGILASTQAPGWIGLGLAGATGFFLALVTYWLLHVGHRLLSWRTFFLVTEIMLLVLASALFIDGIDRLQSMQWLPVLQDPVWDSSAVLDDMGPIGSVMAELTGYRAQPSLTSVLAYTIYWISIAAWLKRSHSQRRHPPPQ